MKIKSGDTVTVLSGKDKGKTGTVLSAMPQTEQVLVEGVNMAVKHQKGTRRGSQGQRIEKPMPMHVSNVAVVDAKTKKPARIGYTIEEGKKVRVTRPSGSKV